MRKPECTAVHEDFRIKRNAEITLLGHLPSKFFIVSTHQSFLAFDAAEEAATLALASRGAQL